MKLLCDQQALTGVIGALDIPFALERRVKLTGWRCRHEANGQFHFVSVPEEPTQEFLLLDMTEEAIWALDKFQSNLGFRKRRVRLEGSRLLPASGDTMFIYEQREDSYLPSPYHTVDHLRLYMGEKRQLSQCDVYLLIPGKLDKAPGVWEALPDKPRNVFSVFNRQINQSVQDEYDTHFADSLSRKCIGEITLKINDLTDGNTYYQDALIGIVKHATGVCILEIMVQNCAIGGNKLLNYYCGNQLYVIYEGQEYTADDFARQLHIRRYGKKRSMVFACGEVSEDEIINALANEEFPMGRIIGDIRTSLAQTNIAQYDTARVFVSQETMLEHTEAVNVFGNQRLTYHAIEIFFVELILFQDAAIDKVYDDLEVECALQSDPANQTDATNRCEEISFDMAQALQFADYDHFRFPTVRISALKVAHSFGLDKIFEKYETNKALLETMIQANKRRRQEQQDRIKNRFLFLLSAAAAIGTVGEILYVMQTDHTSGIRAYLAAFGIIAFIFCIYQLTMQFINSRKHKSMKGGKKP